uniref:p24 n=1 Tax=Pineapple mealybug wilt-associated virus 1 TaxID=180903 RepID=A0A6M4EIX7_9CLOS|nr:p24 [Pineapple mealybug wilt-associated virus 1]
MCSRKPPCLRIYLLVDVNEVGDLNFPCLRMERIILVSKDKNILGVREEEVFYKVKYSLFLCAKEGRECSFFYDKVNCFSDISRSRYTELFSFLDSLGNVVATNNETFLNFLDGLSVDDYMLRRYGGYGRKELSDGEKEAPYLTIPVPALETLWGVMEEPVEELHKVHCVGFVRSCDSSCDELYKFDRSFAVFDCGNGFEVVYGGTIDTSNVAVLRKFKTLKEAEGKTGLEKVVSVLSGL